MKTLGERLVEGLVARGVERVFGIPGVHTIELYRGLAQAPIRHVTARHEQGAAFMADGYARVSGKPGVAFVITGPGLTNALTAMAQAKADSVPMLVISGVNRRDSLGAGMGLLHELPDQAALVRALCPSFQVTCPDQLAPVLDMAFAAMIGERPGPVHVEIPTDVMPLPAPPLVLPVPLAIGAPPPEQIAQALTVLNGAARPVILAGGGTRGAPDLLKTLAERLDAPVVQTVNARGAMFGHPLCVPASPSLDATRNLLSEADVILAIGTELGPTDYDMYVRGGVPDLSAMIRVDSSRSQLFRHPARIRLHADAAVAMQALVQGLQADTDRPNRSGASRATTTRQEARAELARLDPKMPARLAMVEAMRDACPRSIIVGDSTQPVYAANLFHDHDRPGGWFNAATGYGALGFAPGAAIGASLAAPGATVLCLIGDGGLQFSAAELRSAKDEGLPITFIVWNNAGFREIAEAMTAAGIPVIGCAPSPLDLAAFATACGLPFLSVPADPKALAAALQAGPDAPRLIEIRAG